MKARSTDLLLATVMEGKEDLLDVRDQNCLCLSMSHAGPPKLHFCSQVSWKVLYYRLSA